MGGELEGKKRVRSDVREALPLQTRARVVMGVLGILTVANLIAFAADFEFLSVADRLVGGERVPYSELKAADDHLTSSGLAQTVLNVLSIVAFILWYSRAYRNAIAMGIRAPRYGTRWAVWSWFVPLVNLVVPKKVTNDIYRGSDPQMAYGDPDFASRPVSPLLHWWWAAWLLTGVLNRAASGSLNTALTPQEFSNSAKLYIAADLFNAVAAALAIAVVLVITRRSEERRERFALNMERAGEDPSPQPEGPATSFGPPPSTDPQV
jgi:hypothetical protein